MKIFLDAIPLTEIVTGIQRYVRCLYSELESFPDVSVSYCRRWSCSPEMPQQASPGKWSRKMGLIRKLPDSVIVAARVVDRMNFERRLRHVQRQAKYDVFHATAYFPPVINGVPVVFTVYDLSLIKHREKHPRERVWFSDLFFKRRLPLASHIISISDFTRSELIEELGIPPYKITTIHLAQGPAFYRRSKAKILNVLDRHGWPRDYILFVGTLEPRKNLQLLVKALPLLGPDIPLLFTGWSGWGDRAWWEEVKRMGLQNRVILTGYIDEDTLACLYGGASAFVYPSIYEGFGLPVLEAMACGCPVLCTNCASLPEVAGDAAVLIDPYDPEALAHSLERVIHDSALRDRLVDAGTERAKLFSWKKTASETLEVFKIAAGRYRC